MKVRPRLVLLMLLAVAAIAGTLSLGFWQVRRGEAKEVLQRRIAGAMGAAPVELGPALRGGTDALVFRRLHVTGRWRPDQVVYLDNRPQGGRPGFYVLMPLLLDPPFDATVIVDRGWIPRDATDRTRIADYRTPDGAVSLTGVALAEEPRLLELGSNADRRLGGIWQNFDFDAFGRLSGREPVRLVIRQDRDGSGPDGLDRDWPDQGGTLQAQIDRHHGYAFQWFALSATLAALLLFQLFRSFRHGRDPSR